MYCFKCTLKQTRAAGKLPKGITVQVPSNFTSPQPKELAEAIENQLGISCKGLTLSAGDFDVRKM